MVLLCIREITSFVKIKGQEEKKCFMNNYVFMYV